eukprot:CAMPEP_0183718574 /NCGR_PEP_ID=MMETSP0737-20130205/11801_1 /TAXON_ID=385413 /ORGANISM="Thalassiosira miniscula, Strain CCMP1093" /LENGTH=524 /DNA_ID=CAMNT_0025948163 /DNA_START=90 /DNA_END=1664 /DNA_ORIENTATION=-
MGASKRNAPMTAISALLAALINLPLHAVAETVTVIHSLSDLPMDENGHLSSHVLAYPNSGPCASLIESNMPNRGGLYNHVPIAVDGDAATALFGDEIPDGSEDHPVEDVSDCPAVCLDRGVDAELVAYPIPENYYNPKEDENHNSFSNFVASLSCGRVEFGFINYTPNTLSMYWVDHKGNEVYLNPLERLEKNTRFIHTSIGHRFVFKDQGNRLFLDHTVEFNGVIGISNHINKHRHRDIRSEVQSTMRGEWSKHLQVKRTFSSLGFNKGRLPDDVFGSMRSYWYNNRDPPHRLQEEWDSKGLYVNHWESDCNFIQIPWDLKKIWQYRLKDVVQEWVGVEIEQTDLYGIRQYEAGARLLTHVDRITTHAVSLIVNIAQGNLTAPWTVEVYDHADRLHEVAMTPGDIVYYESAKALHGRNTPLAGGFYANVFTHYRPIGDPSWYTKENPEGTPEPLIDVGECKLVGKPDEYSAGAVQCDNPAIGPHLSPKMITATSGEDLYQLWLSVGPSYEDETKKATPEKDEL